MEEVHEWDPKNSKDHSSVCVKHFPIREETELFSCAVTWWQLFYFHSSQETKHNLWHQGLTDRDLFSIFLCTSSSSWLPFNLYFHILLFLPFLLVLCLLHLFSPGSFVILLFFSNCSLPFCYLIKVQRHNMMVEERWLVCSLCSEASLVFSLVRHVKRFFSPPPSPPSVGAKVWVSNLWGQLVWWPWLWTPCGFRSWTGLTAKLDWTYLSPWKRSQQPIIKPEYESA